MDNQSVNHSFTTDSHIFPLLDKINTQFQHSFNDSEDEIDEDRCYLMEIEQLKRENNFLKKKIQELTKKNPAFSNIIAKSRPSLQAIKQKMASESVSTNKSQNYIISFLQQVTGLLKSFGQLFEISYNSTLKEEINKEHETFNRLTESRGKEIQKQLSKLLLQAEQNKFSELLGIFESYYLENKQRQQNMKSKIESLTSQAIELGKNMAGNLRSRERLKSSKVYTTNNNEDYRKSDNMSLKSSIIKSTCTESQMLDLSLCRGLLGKEKMFDGIF